MDPFSLIQSDLRSPVLLFFTLSYSRSKDAEREKKNIYAAFRISAVFG